MKLFDVEASSAIPASLSRTTAKRYMAASIAALTAGIAVYWRATPRHLAIVKVELGGAGQAWPVSGVSKAVWWDFALIAGYALALWFAMLLAQAVFWSQRARAIARGATWLALTAVVADVVENILLLISKYSGHTGLLDWATAAAVIKFSCLTPAAVVGVAALLVTALRLVTNTHKRLEGRKPIEVCPTIPLTSDDPLPSGSLPRPGDSRAPDAERWRRGYLVPDLHQEVVEVGAGKTVGICLSGGGVRSASVALGALQSLRTQLKQARYLVSVSGGGYTAGAFQLAMTDAGDARRAGDDTPVHDADQVFVPGSVEEDWVRRHADYLADSPAKMFVALGVVARVLLLSLAFLFGPAIVLGVLVGRALKRFPLAEWHPGTLHPWLNPDHLPYPGVRTGTWFGLGVLVGVALIAYGVAISVAWPHVADVSRSVAKGFTLLTLVVAAIAIGIPSVAFGAAWLLSRADTGSIAIGGSVGTILLSYGATLGSLVRSKTVKEKTGGLFKRKGSAVGAAPTGAVQLAFVVLTLLALAVAWFLLFGGMAAIADKHDVALVTLIGFALLLVFSITLDQTSLSLHPFYRRQLAGAFATRRVRRNDGNSFAEGYDFREVTTLSDYGKRPASNGSVQNFPEVIFAATANLTGEERAPLNGVPYTFSANWVGGPDIGYVRTADLEHQLELQHAIKVSHDLTVQAAVAISGAAFASAMGRANRWYGTLLAVTGVRLGSWLPNPVFIEKWNAARDADQWTLPAIPKLRRLPYLIREVLGIHQFSDRLLQVTDGGHYENLGLVELLRRRCTEIYCIDASGDSPPTATTLEQALTIAYAELGVMIELDDKMWDLVPGAGSPLEPASAFTSLNARLTKQAVVSATITYPPESGLPDSQRTGTLIFAKTLVTPSMEYEVLSYAARNDIFPRDSTGDQFFDDGKFCAYRALGQELGALADKRVRSLASDAEPELNAEGDSEPPDVNDGVLPDIRRLLLNWIAENIVGGEQ